VHALRLTAPQAGHTHLEGQIAQYGQLVKRTSRCMHMGLIILAVVLTLANQGMKRNGNIASNRTYNPQNKKPQIPLDVDEVDSALERFIRQKYDQQSFSSNAPRPAVRHDTGSTRSSDDQPPPLPPKPGKRFGFGLRSVSSVLPLSRSNRTTPATSPDGSTGFGAPPSPIRVNKQSRVFGASVGGSNGEEMDAKLGTLRDMGFSDDRKNVSIMKGLGGNLERTIEALVRLGEGSAPSSRSRTPAQPRNVAVSQPLPSVPDTQAPARTNGAHPVSNGSAFASQISFPAQSSNQGVSTSQEQSDRSFSPATSQASDMSFHSTNPFQPRAYNPFETTHGPQPANYPPAKAFENMFVSQPLFPNATGGYPQPQPHVQDPRIQHSMTPPVPQIPQQHLQSNQYAQQAQPPMGNYNPFMQASQLNHSIPANPYAAPIQQQNNGSSFNPFMNFQETVIQSPISETPHPSIYQQQVPQSFFQQHQQPQQPPPSLAPQQPNASMTQQPHTYLGSSHYQQPQQQYTQLPPAPLQPQPTGRVDKSSIMALYNYPHFAPPPLNNISEDGVIQSSPSNEVLGPQYPTEVQPRQPQRSVTMPAQMASGSRNPFQSAVSADPGTSMAPAIAVNGSGSSRHVSQESVDIGGFQSGRHSPDAFASLSANYVR